LPVPGPPVRTENLLVRALTTARALEFGMELEAGLGLRPRTAASTLMGGRPLPARGEAGDGGGDLLLGAVVVRELDQTAGGRAGSGRRAKGACGCRQARAPTFGGAPAAIRPVADEGLGSTSADDAGGRGDAGGDVGFEQVGGVVDEVGLAVGGVALLLQGLEGEDDAGVEPRRGVVGEAEVDGDAVGGLEADAVDLAGDAVGFGGEDAPGVAAEVGDELHALRRG
jgi:hypothetical protein